MEDIKKLRDIKQLREIIERQDREIQEWKDKHEEEECLKINYQYALVGAIERMSERVLKLLRNND